MCSDPLICPDCGLVLETELDHDGSSTDNYEAWQARCTRPHLGGPVWCLVARDGTSAGVNEPDNLNEKPRRQPEQPEANRSALTTV